MNLFINTLIEKYSSFSGERNRSPSRLNSVNFVIWFVIMKEISLQNSDLNKQNNKRKIEAR